MDLEYSSKQLNWDKDILNYKTDQILRNKFEGDNIKITRENLEENNLQNFPDQSTLRPSSFNQNESKNSFIECNYI